VILGFSSGENFYKVIFHMANNVYFMATFGEVFIAEN